ncbi:hypothetical protein BDV11DRAFT_9392 [Aspergillus similis]
MKPCGGNITPTKLLIPLLSALLDPLHGVLIDSCISFLVVFLLWFGLVRYPYRAFSIATRLTGAFSAQKCALSLNNIHYNTRIEGSNYKLIDKLVAP